MYMFVDVLVAPCKFIFIASLSRLIVFSIHSVNLSSIHSVNLSTEYYLYHHLLVLLIKTELQPTRLFFLTSALTVNNGATRRGIEPRPRR